MTKNKEIKQLARKIHSLAIKNRLPTLTTYEDCDLIVEMLGWKGTKKEIRTVKKALNHGVEMGLFEEPKWRGLGGSITPYSGAATRAYCYDVRQLK